MDNYLGNNPSHDHYDRHRFGRSLVTCYCISCGKSFYRNGSEITSKMMDNSFITKKILQEALDNNKLGRIKIKNYKDWVVIKGYLCDECFDRALPKFLKKQISEEDAERKERLGDTELEHKSSMEEERQKRSAELLRKKSLGEDNSNPV